MPAQLQRREEYVAEHAEARARRYTHFCEHDKAFTAPLMPSMRQHRRAGAKRCIDYASSTLPLLDGGSGHVFDSAPGASGYTFAGTTAAERLEDWIDSMTRALTSDPAVTSHVPATRSRCLAPLRHLGAA